MNERYYQVYNTKLDKWVKIDASTGLIVGVNKKEGKYNDIPTKKPIVIKRKAFWDYF